MKLRGCLRECPRFLLKNAHHYRLRCILLEFRFSSPTHEFFNVLTFIWFNLANKFHKGFIWLIFKESIPPCTCVFFQFNAYISIIQDFKFFHMLHCFVTLFNFAYCGYLGCTSSIWLSSAVADQTSGKLGYFEKSTNCLCQRQEKRFFEIRWIGKT